MRRFTGAIATLLLAGCTAPTTPPQPAASPSASPTAAPSTAPQSLATAQMLHVQGQVLQADGSPAAGMAIYLFQLGGQANASAHTDAQGRYEANFAAKDFQPTADGPARLTVSTQAPNLALVSQTLPVTEAEVSLPPLRFVQPRMQPDADGNLSLSWDAPAQGQTDYTVYVHALTPDRRGSAEVIVSKQGSGQSVTIPKYLLNDATDYTWTATVTANQRSFSSATPRMPFTSPADATKRVLPIAGVADDQGRSCPWLFDGNLQATGEARTARAIDIDLGKVQTVSKLVAYNVNSNDPVPVRVAMTAGAFGQPLAELSWSQGGEEVDLAGVQARYIRLETPNGVDLKLTELRVVGP